MSRRPSSNRKVLRCPTCGTIVVPEGADFPFCSGRCQLIDLGKWASGAYRITSPVLDPEVLEDFESAKKPQKNDDEE
ncbi:MAG: DNA gyrase inhibitor YacG [Bacillota bacterium]|nr:DNA gyrase inhibitor YacG [Bacillota bacterium]